MNRRAFFAALAGQPARTAPASGGDSGMTMRTGTHGERVSLLGYGAMRYPTVDGSHANTYHGGSKAAIDIAAVQQHIDYCIAHGVNYFDTSPAYCRGESEKVLGDALAKHPRDKWFVATKLSNFAPKTHPFEASRKMYEESRRLLRTDVIDFYLLHSIGGGPTRPKALKLFDARFIDNGMLDFLLKEREAGRIRNLGFSFHGNEAVFRHALSLHDKVHWDFVQIQLNWVDWHHAQEVNKRNVNAETLYNLLDERGIPVVVMEPLLGGRLARVNERVMRKLAPLDPAATPAQWSFRFAGSLPRVLTVMSGMMLGCEVNRHATFDRKNYFYPDMAKDYQISENGNPLCIGGGVEITRAGLGDYCCPPTGLAKMWNNMTCPKKILWVQGSTHGYVPPEKHQDFVLEEPAK